MVINSALEYSAFNRNTDSYYEYEIISNQELKKAIEKRNDIIKNGDIIKMDNSPYSEIEDEDEKKDEKKSEDKSEDKNDSISEYY